MSSKPSSDKSERPESSSPSEVAKALTEIAAGLSVIGDALEQWVKLQQQVFELEHPIRNPSPVTVVAAKYSDPEKDQPEKPQPGEDLFEGLGPRERKVLETRFAKQKARSAPPPGDLA